MLHMEGSDIKAGEKFQKSYFDVLGLCCSSEVPLIEKILNSLDGIKDFSVIVPTKTLIVVHDSLLISQIQIVKALNQARLEANIRAYGDTNYKKKWPSPYAVASGTLLMLSFLKYFYSPLSWLAVVAIAVGIPPIILKAVAAVRNLKLDINILVLITVSGSIVLHDYWEAATIVFLFTISEWLESRASHKATAVMSSLVSVVPQRAVLAETGEEINADEVKLNTILAVKAGEVIPIDGVVVEGNCEVDEKIMTGESFPVTKQKDSTVWASTINVNGYISMKTTAVAEDCVVARMAKIVEEAQNKKSKTQRFLDKCATYYTPAIVVISASLAIVPLVFHVQNKKQWYHLALVVLVSGCPCALLLSTPVAMFCALSKAATLGVLFKGAEHLETLSQIKIMAFDKTGTITRGEFLVVDFKSLHDDISLNTLLYWISSIESKSSHPMAAALVDFARSHGIEPKPDRVEKFQNFPGEGISGKIDDNELYIGNLKIASRAGCTAVPELEGYDIEGKSVGYIFLGSSPAGIFCLSDACRTGAKEAIQELKSMGIKTVMLTGDCHGAAKRAQEQLGGALDIIHAELLPEDKASVIKELQKESRTAMIGDGLNDAPALATANIGISMSVSGSALATESGDIVLMTNDIQRIAKAFRIAKRVRRKIIENVMISISTKAAIVGLAIAGHPLVWAAVLADVGTCLLVIFNSMLLLKGSGAQNSHNHKHKFKGATYFSRKSQNSDNGSCGNKKCSSGHDHDVHHHTHSEDIVKDHQCCREVNQDFESQRSSKHGCSGSGSVSCGKKKCSTSKKEEHCHDAHHHHHPHDEYTVKDHQCLHRVKQEMQSQRSHDHDSCSGPSSGSHGTKKCSSSSKEQGHNADDHQHGDCHRVEPVVESQRLYDHCCSGSGSGSESHGNKKCSSSVKEHSHNAQPHAHGEDVVKDHQCCGMVEQDLESQTSHNHGCSEKARNHEKNSCAKSVQKHDHCMTDDENHSTEKHEHQNHTTNCKNSSQASILDESVIPHNHCLESHCMNHKNNNHSEIELEDHDEKCCRHTPRKHDAGSECENHGTQHCKPTGSSVNMLECENSAECNTICMASRKMQRGCCDSFRRECCMGKGHINTNFGGGLSEIVID